MRNKILIVATSAVCLMLAACESSAPTSNKDMLPKMSALAASTFEHAPKKLTATPIPASVPIPPAVQTWKDSAGTTYTLNTTQNLSYVVTPPVVVTPPPVSATVGPPTVTTPSTTKNPGLLPGGPWVAQTDPGTGSGTSTGTMTYPVAGVNGTNTARQYSMTYTNAHGELFHVSFGTDTVATHFIYDTWVFFPDVSQLQNVELDMNQVVANGNTVILATQCASGSKTWEYTLKNSGGGTSWHPSNIPCNPLAWTPNVWHHIQIATEHDANGNVTYDWVGVDGYYSNFAAVDTGNSSYPLKWAIGTLLINFQLDGLSKVSGAITAKMDQTTVYRW